MMYMLREQLTAKNIATSWGQHVGSTACSAAAAETTPAVLARNAGKSSLESCEAEGQWTLKDESKQTMKNVGKIALPDWETKPSQTKPDSTSWMPHQETTLTWSKPKSLMSKEDIKDVIQKLLNDPANKYQRVVFFVDDLDRIPPTDAVEVLEALKNMFDIPNCIFVLAIDYEVVVKGLESKFGEENRRK